MNIDIQVSIGDAPHGVAERAKAPGNAATDIKPCYQRRADYRRDRKHDQYELPGADLPARVSGYVLRNAALLLDETIDSVLELGSLGLRGCERQLGVVLLAKLVGARGDNPVLRRDHGELLIESNELFLLSAVADRIQVFGNFALGGIDKVAQRFQTTRIADEGCFCQKSREEV